MISLNKTVSVNYRLLPHLPNGPILTDAAD